jgi:polyphosphate kinase
MKQYLKYPFINREISWLHFNERVLQEAMDKDVPLLERLRFLGIFSNNRDEFFRVRVASLKRLIAISCMYGTYDQAPQLILDEILQIVANQEKIFTETYLEIVNELKKKNLFILNEKEISEEQGEIVRSYFQKAVQPYLFPIFLKNFKNSHAIKDGSIYLAVVLKSDDPAIKREQALIKMPTKIVSRFYILPPQGAKKYIIMLDDIIRYCLDEIFTVFGFNHFEAYTIKITRDAELDIDDDISKSFMDRMQDSVKQRKKGEPVRFVYDENIPGSFLQKLLKKLKIKERDNLRGGGRYHNFKDFMEFPAVDTRLSYENLFPMTHPALPKYSSVFGQIRKQDLMLHFPYQSFNHIVDLLREASLDPKVTSIRMTLYRVAHYSIIANALVNAARNGKKVIVFLEIKARFDETTNINLTRKFQNEGITIIQTIPRYKVHAKLISITRIEDGTEKYYTNISTGNYNESTSTVYADDSLLTYNQGIGRDVIKVFEIFEERYMRPSFEHLIVAPFNLRSFFVRMLEREIQNAKEGKEAWAIIKLNNLADKKIAKKIYQAGMAGVKIKLIIRGICILKPNQKGVSENIEGISIVDRFLEHSRVLIFANGGETRYFTGSADWMPRNFDHRIEIMTPIYDKNVQRELRAMIDIQLRDNVKARISKNDSPNRYKQTNEQPQRSQYKIYEYLIPE